MREAWNVTALDVLRVQILIFSSVGSKTKKSNMHLQFKPMIYSMSQESEFSELSIKSY